jgi:protein-L-isoaspartate(D-aspartate) O-methyltransferase
MLDRASVRVTIKRRANWPSIKEMMRMTDFPRLRKQMLEEQLVPRGIRDKAVLAAMGEVPREEFVPPEMSRYAYEDGPLPIGRGQTISQPFMVAYMAQVLELARTDRVLEIGTGSGYAAAVVSRIAAEVHSIERVASLAEEARVRLRDLGYLNIHVHVGDGSLGLPDFAPYDAIVVTAGAPWVPEALKEQLGPGGRLVIPVGSHLDLQELVRVRRTEADGFASERLMGVRFVPLVGADGWQGG